MKASDSIYIKLTLPVSEDGSLSLDQKISRSFGEKLSESYINAAPFPHIVIDEFLPISFAEELLKLFPLNSLSGDEFYEEGYTGLHKRQISPESCVGRVRNIFHFFNSAPILQFLEGLTSINSLIGDPYFDGGGFHETSHGGKLGIHADFRINKKLNLSRRINMIIYLNKDWNESYGGNLELWDSGMRRKFDSIAPIFNRCVIFNTNADSYHGHPDPLVLPDNITRKSIALYFYTASKSIYKDIPAHSTMYVARQNDSSDLKRQVSKLRRQNYLNDWLPPIAFRLLSNVKKVIKKYCWVR
jgi:hypothetical protein